MLRDSYFDHHPRRSKKTRRARKKLRTIAGRLLRELERELTTEQFNTYRQQIDLYWKVITQQRSDTDKVYSLHCEGKSP